MAILPIETKAKNKILRTVSGAVKVGKVGKRGAVGKGKGADKVLCRFLDDMRDTMFAAPGIGLAAPQVSQNIRVVICLFNNDTDNEMVVEMINPEITARSKEMDVHEEGCLSLPGEFDEVQRHVGLTVKFLDRKGVSHVLKLEGLNARIVQHEVDHIDGKLYIDRVRKV